MIDERFALGDSILHRLDPRAKILAALLPALLTAILQNPSSAALSLIMALALTMLSHPPVKPLLKRILAVNGFVAFLWIILPFSTPGHEVGRWGPLFITVEGLKLAFLITLKSNALVLLFLALPGTTPAAELGLGMSRLGLPDKLCRLLVFSYRYVHVLAQEYQRLATAARIRGFKPGTNLHTYRTAAYLAAMVLVRSYDRAQRIHQAMLLRGFQGRFHSLNDYAFQTADYAFVAGSILACGLLAAVEWT